MGRPESEPIRIGRLVIGSADEAADDGASMLAEQELLRSAAAGDQRSFDVLYHRHVSSLYRFFVRKGVTDEDAVDLTQQTFCQILTAFRSGQYRAEDSSPRGFVAYLARTAYRNWVAYLRREKSQRRQTRPASWDDEGEDILDTIPAEDTSPFEALAAVEDDATRKRLQEIVREVTTTLRPDYQRIIRLRYHDEMSYKDIAIQLSLPMGTVATHLARATTALQNALSHHPVVKEYLGYYRDRRPGKRA